MLEAERPEIDTHGLTDTGQVRMDNQDAIMACLPADDLTVLHGHLYGVADGIGGFSHGEIASTLALETLFKTFYASEGLSTSQRLKQGVHDANLGVFETAQRLGTGRMGTTLTAVHLHGHTLHVVHVGDSRAYLVRDGVATCLTNDHTRVGELVRMRLLSPDKVRTHNQRSVLNRCLGLELFVQPDLFTVEAREDDLIVLCTDGVWGHLEDQVFAQFAAKGGTLEEYNQGLLEEALRKGSDDNLSLLTLRLRSLTSPHYRNGSKTGLGAFFSKVFRR